MAESVLFDPGYSGCVLGFSDNIEFMYSIFEGQIMPVKQKKFQFSVILPKIKSMITGSCAFYLGCLLWAVYIKSKKGAVIEDNPCLEDEYDEEKTFEETNYLYEFITEKLVKDVKFFLNKEYKPDSEYVTILETYNEFLKLNKGFTNTKTTDDIVLPKNIKTPDSKELECIKEKIDEAVQAKDLTKLLCAYSYILS